MRGFAGVVVVVQLASAPAAGADGPAALFARFECARCHDGVGEPPAPEKRCTGCHRDIISGSFRAPPRLLASWRANLVSLRQAPSLAGVGRRFGRAWVRDFLLAPRDLRPALAATMPRLPLSPADAEALAAALVPGETPAPAAPPAADVARGRALYRRLRCGSCHAFSGAGVDDDAGAARPGVVGRGRGDRAPADGIALAPDLAVTRARFQTGNLLAWLRDPQALAPGSTMPGLPASEVSDADLAALAAFVVAAPVAANVPASAPPARLPPLRRRVRYAEVEAAVLRKICWHCHAQPDLARGDGGPGNSGGFGFPARGLDLSTSAAVASGAVGDDGRRHSIFLPGADGRTPLLVERLLARQREEAGRPDPRIRGMPLGFPALSAEEIQLVESWVSQGRPP